MDIFYILLILLVGTIVIFLIKELWELHFYNDIYTNISFELFEKHYKKSPEYWRLEKFYVTKYSKNTTKYVSFSFNFVDYIKYINFYYVQEKKVKKELIEKQKKKDLNFLNNYEE